LKEEERGDERFIPIPVKTMKETRDKKYPFYLWIEYNYDYYKSLDLSKHNKKLERIRDSMWIKLSSEDAEKMGLEDGEQVKVESPYGKINGFLKITDLIFRGYVKATLSWDCDYGVSFLSIINKISQKSKSIRRIPCKIRRGN
ncbi:MAG: molybdopterin dinucleotide binding domain-containing protein, partial [Candidatus Aminicenantaceae bacterium]